MGQAVELGFALKVIRDLEFGFAAGVGFAAVALPCQTLTLNFGLCPWCGLGLIKGQSPHEGRSPGNKPADVGGHSHRREANSGGKALRDVAHDF